MVYIIKRVNVIGFEMYIGVLFYVSDRRVVHKTTTFSEEACKSVLVDYARRHAADSKVTYYEPVRIVA